MATARKHATDDDIERRGPEPSQGSYAFDRDHWATQMTTMGRSRFPLFAYREQRVGGTVTRTPARADVVPLLGRCRSSYPCLEWAAGLGKNLPFRRAQNAVALFSDWAVEEDEATIAAHPVAVGGMLDRQWPCRPLHEIPPVLDERATRDKETGPRVVYLSTDARAERRCVDETWSAAWKSANDLRLWTVDRRRGHGTTGSEISPRVTWQQVRDWLGGHQREDEIGPFLAWRVSMAWGRPQMTLRPGRGESPVLLPFPDAEPQDRAREGVATSTARPTLPVGLRSTRDGEDEGRGARRACEPPSEGGALPAVAVPASSAGRVRSE